MSNRKPLVLGDDASTQQLQSQDALDIPLDERVNVVEWKLDLLIKGLMMQGIELPEELIDG